MPFPLLAVLAGASLIGGGIKKKKAANAAQAQAQAQQAYNDKASAYDQQQQQRTIDDTNAANAKNENARLSRFNLATSILESLGDVVSPETLQAVKARSGMYNPLVNKAAPLAPSAPVAKPQGYGLLDFGVDAIDEVGQYAAGRADAKKYEDIFNELSGGGSKSIRATPSAPKFGSGVNFGAGRPALHQQYKF